MRRLRFTALALAVSTTLLAVTSFAAAKGAKGKDAERLARGKYLVTVMGCTDCHTPGTFYGDPDMSRFLSGSEMGWAGPWGIVYAANLTPDLETGLGSWTADEIAKAIRTGNRPDGRQLAAIMPWLNFSNLTSEDALAMAHYLLSLKPVKHEVPKPLPPGVEAKGPVHTFPPPSAWDAPRTPQGDTPGAK
jgi:mono/diheme cytochrome c family protein